MNILIVAETNNSLESLKARFDNMDCTVFTGMINSLPLYILEEHRISLIIIDVINEYTTAIDFCLKIRKQSNNRCKILVLVDENHIDLASDCLDAGADHYLTKPYNNRQLSNYLMISKQLLQKESLFEIDNKILCRDLHLSPTLLNYTNDLIQIIDSEGKYIYVNSVWQQELNYTDEDIDSLSFYDLILSDSTAIRQSIETASEQKKASLKLTMEIARKDNSSIHVEGLIHCIDQAEGEQYLFCAFTNMTEFVNLLNSIKVSEEKYKHISETAEEELLQLKKAVETMKLGVTISNLNRKIIYTNPAEATMHGYQVDELIGKDVGIFAPEMIRSPLSIDQLQELIGLTRESINIRKDGSVFPVRLISDVVKDSRGESIALITTCEDITEQKKAELALKESEEKFRRLTETAPLAIFIIHDQKFIYVNPAAIRMTGYEENELLTMDLGDLVATSQSDSQKSGYQPPEAKQTSRYEMLIRSKKGTTIWVYLSITGIEYQGYSALLGTATDITEQKRVEIELRMFNERLEQKVRERTQELNDALEKEKSLHELKTQFISLVSHEFRTPLTSISSSAEIIQRYSDRLTETKKIHYLDRIRANVQEMTALLDDVTFLGKTDSYRMTLNPSKINLDSFFLDIIEEVELSYKNKCSITFNNESHQAVFFLDESLIHHIVINLLTNSMKFSQPGELISVRCYIQKNKLMIEITDAGCGIPEEDKTHIFEAFCRAKNVEKIEGTGLGLTIVKRCLDLHGGDISFTSTENEKTQFIVTLPLINNDNLDIS